MENTTQSIIDKKAPQEMVNSLSQCSPHLSLFTLVFIIFCLSFTWSCESEGEDAGSEEVEQAGTESSSSSMAEMNIAGEVGMGGSTDIEEGGDDEMNNTNNDHMMMLDQEVQPEPETPFCVNDAMIINSDKLRFDRFPMYLGYNTDEEDSSIFQVDFRGVQTVGTYDLEGSTPMNCELCVFLARNCIRSGCQQVFLATSGTVEITEFGEPGGVLSATLRELNFTAVDSRNNMLRDTPRFTCLQEHSFEKTIPSKIGDVIPEFSLQNCETEEMVSIKDAGAESAVLWMIGTAGWCPACRQHLGALFRETFPMFTLDQLRPMIVVSEDENYRPATLEFCKEYASRYEDDASRFYVDPRLETMHAYIHPYTDENGVFGLPWDVLVNGSTQVYSYASLTGLVLLDVLAEILGLE